MKKRFTHWAIAKAAKEIAASWYEGAAQDDGFYKAHPSSKAFVAAYWTNFTGEARAALGRMLAGNYPDSVKDDIVQILALDQTLPGNRHISAH